MIFIYILLAIVFPPLGIPALIWFILKRRHSSTDPAKDNNWYFQVFLSREDSLSQLFLLLAVSFLGLTIQSLNRDFSSPLNWQTIVLLTSLAGFAGAYYFKAVLVLIISLLGFLGWWISQMFSWAFSQNFKTVSIMAGFVFFSLFFYVWGRAQERMEKSRRFALVYLILGIIFVSGLLFFLSAKIGLGRLEDLTGGAPVWVSWQATLSLLILAVALAASVSYSSARRLITWPEAGAVSLLAILFTALVLLPKQIISLSGGNLFSSSENLSLTGISWAIIFNVTIFLEILGLILLGYKRREEWLVNLSTTMLFVFIVVKYVDWMFSFMDKGFFFIGAGILMFGVGYAMENGRRLVLANLKGEQPAAQT